MYEWQEQFVNKYCYTACTRVNKINYTPHFLFKQALNSPYVTESCYRQEILAAKTQDECFSRSFFPNYRFRKNISRNYKILKNKIMLKPRKGQQNRLGKYMNTSSEECQHMGTYKKPTGMDIKALKTQKLSRLIQDQQAECIGFIINSVTHAFVCADKIYLKPCI